MSIELLDYNADKSVAIFNSESEWNEHFKSHGGRFNFSLTHPQTQEKTKGWIFSSKHKPALEELVAKIQAGAGPSSVPTATNFKPTNDIYIRDFNEERFAIFGNTIAHKEQLKKMKCVYNSNIVDPDTKRKCGWTCIHSLRSIVQLYIDTGKLPNEALSQAPAVNPRAQGTPSPFTSDTLSPVTLSSTGITAPLLAVRVGQNATVFNVFYSVSDIPRPWMVTMTKFEINPDPNAAKFPQTLNAYFVPSEGGWIADPSVMNINEYGSQGWNKVAFE